MKRRLVLNAPTDRIAYKTLLLGFLSGGQTEQDKGKDAIYSLSRIKKALFACGEVFEVPLQVEADDKANIAVINDPGVLVYRPGQAIRLKDGEHVLELAQGDFDRIERHMTRASWNVVAADEVADVYDRLSTAETIKD